MLIEQIYNTQFLTSPKEISKWLFRHGVTQFSIKPNTLEVDVNEHVVLGSHQIDFLPVKFRHINGNFDCSDNFLTTLEGAPDIVTGDFWCDKNRLTNLQYAPNIVGANFNCNNNKLTTLKGAPKRVPSMFFCNNNKLTSLEGAPEYVGHNFSCSINKLQTLQGCPPHLNYKLTCNGDNDTLSNITKFIKSTKIIALVDVNPNLVYFMWAFFIKSLQKIELYSATAEQKNVMDIINTHLSSDRSGPACQLDLIDAGLGKYIKL